MEMLMERTKAAIITTKSGASRASQATNAKPESLGHISIEFSFDWLSSTETDAGDASSTSVLHPPAVIQKLYLTGTTLANKS